MQRFASENLLFHAILAFLAFTLCPALLAQTKAADLTSIQHIVFIVKENRAFDHYFGAFPGADGASGGITSDLCLD